jgi:hypothetical protein
MALCNVHGVTNDLQSVLTDHRALAATLHLLLFQMDERRRLLEERLAHLVRHSESSIEHRRRVWAQLDDKLSTENGLLNLYRIYLLDGDGIIIFREDDTHAGNDALAVPLGWRLLDARKAEQPTARGIEIWRGRRRVFSSPCKLDHSLSAQDLSKIRLEPLR